MGTRRITQTIRMRDKMPKVQTRQLGVFLHLAQAWNRRRRPLMRDRMLVLAGALASEIGLSSVAEYCRYHVLQHNPHHLIRRWPTLMAALEDEDFQSFLKQVRRRYPAEKAERILDNLGLTMARERDAYYSDSEYAAAILGMTPAELDRLHGRARPD